VPLAALYPLATILPMLLLKERLNRIQLGGLLSLIGFISSRAREEGSCPVAGLRAGAHRLWVRPVSCRSFRQSYFGELAFWFLAVHSVWGVFLSGSRCGANTLANWCCRRRGLFLPRQILRARAIWLGQGVHCHALTALLPCVSVPIAVLFSAKGSVRARHRDFLASLPWRRFPVKRGLKLLDHPCRTQTIMTPITTC